MFTHLFIYRLKIMIRSKSMIFWTLLFPIALSTFFNMAFGNLSSQSSFDPINIALVDSSANPGFTALLDELSSGEDKMFNLQKTSQEEATELLRDEKITGYITASSSPSLTVNNTGIYQSILKIFLDEYNQTSKSIERIISLNPNAIKDIATDISNRTIYTVENPISKNPINVVLTYFYALLAMTSFYGSFFGLEEINYIQANLSPHAARINLAPTHKLKAFLSSGAASFVIQLTEMFIFLGYLNFVLKIDFGAQTAYIILTTVIGSLTAISFGAFIGVFSKGQLNVKYSILIGSTMMGSFLAGMMFSEMKYIVQTKLPILAWLNPLNLLTDAFYSLYYFGVDNRYWNNIFALLIFTTLFCIFTYSVLRRRKYDSI